VRGRSRFGLSDRLGMRRRRAAAARRYPSGWAPREEKRECDRTGITHVVQVQKQSRKLQPAFNTSYDHCFPEEILSERVGLSLENGKKT
jgi:hypothetical protein